MHAAEDRPDERVPGEHGRDQDANGDDVVAQRGVVVLSDSDRRSLDEIEHRLRAEEPMLPILARRLEPPLSQRSRVSPSPPCRAGTVTVMVGVLAIIGWLGSLPLALLAGSVVAVAALALGRRA